MTRYRLPCKHFTTIEGKRHCDICPELDHMEQINKFNGLRIPRGTLFPRPKKGKKSETR